MFRIWKKILRIIAIILPCFLAVFISNNVFAVSDVTYTITSESSSPINLCGFDTGLDCQDYPYIFIDSDIYYQNAFGKTITFDIGYSSGSVDSQISLFTDSFRFSINSDMIRIRVYRPGTSTLPVGNTITITLGTGGAPSGSITLTENGTYDVTSYAEAVVDVPATIVPGDYHDDLISIRNVIIIGASVILVLYFFYCIYGIIIPTTGGKR